MATSLAYACPECPQCEEFVLPPVQSADCPEGQVLEQSEIKRLLIAELDPTDNSLPENGPADWTDPADWETAIDNTASSGAVKQLFGLGDVAEPEDTNITTFGFNEVLLRRQYPMTFTLQDGNDVNYNFVRALQCGATVRIWYETNGNYLYGGQNGILARIVRVTAPKERGIDSVVNYNFEIVWSAKCEPERVFSPFAPVEAGE